MRVLDGVLLTEAHVLDLHLDATLPTLILLSSIKDIWILDLRQAGLRIGVCGAGVWRARRVREDASVSRALNGLALHAMGWCSTSAEWRWHWRWRLLLERELALKVLDAKSLLLVHNRKVFDAKSLLLVHNYKVVDVLFGARKVGDQLRI